MIMPTLETLTIDDILGNLPHVARLPKADHDALKLALIRQNFAMHYERNDFFRAQCEATGMTAEALQSLQDLKRIPLIPMRTFKQSNAHVLLSVPLQTIDLELRSTGTSGLPTVTRRDHVTTTRISLALMSLYRDFFGISNGVGLFLCPSTAETPEMGLVKVFNLFCGMLDDRTYLVRDYSFRAEEAVAYLKAWENKQTRYIFGPPFLINRLLRYLEREALYLPLDPDTMIITLGGWKRFTGENIGRDAFDAKLQRYLGVQPQQIRDMYGMIESNLLAIECEYHRKHIPAWCYVSIRDVADVNVELPLGHPGVVAILDAMSNSYPSYILSEDVGEISFDGTCECGRTGQVISFHRRLQGAELGCCAVSIDRFMAEQEIALECEIPSERAHA